MGFLARVMPAAVSVTVVAGLTGILWYLRLTEGSPRNPAFFYVLPLIVVAIIYGSRPALLGVLAAFACADYFLYDPLYSFEFGSRGELGDLTCFSLLAIIGVKCVSELFGPAIKFPAVRSYFERR